MKTSLRHKGMAGAAVSLLISLVLSVAGGCTGTRAYVAHDYEFGPGEGTVEYRVGDGHYRHHKPKKPRHKKPKYKKVKHKKPKKHDRHHHKDHRRGHDHDD